MLPCASMPSSMVGASSACVERVCERVVQMKLALCTCLLFLSCCSVASAGEHLAPQTCSYVSFNWNIHQKRAVNVSQVSHPYAELRAEEIDAATGCTVCEEDQQLLRVGRLPPFLVCRRIADRVRAQL